MIQKQAIMLNLAGAARNNPDGTVKLSLQGDKQRIDKVLDVIRAGNKKSSTANTVNLTDAPLDPNLNTFTVYAWTSTTRNITNPYDLVFHLRPTGDQISKKEAEAVWNYDGRKHPQGRRSYQIQEPSRRRRLIPNFTD